MIPVEAQLLRLLHKREAWETFGDLVDPTLLPTKEYQRLFDLVRQYHVRDLGLPHKPDLSPDLLWQFVVQKDKVDSEHGSYQMYMELVGLLKNDDTPDGMARDLVSDYVRGTGLAQIAQLSARWDETGAAALRDQLWTRAKELAQSLEQVDDTGDGKVEPRSLRENPDMVGEDYERIPMGVAPRIDEAVGGGFPVGKLVCAVAPPGVGKTRLLVNIGAEAVRRGRNVVHATLEIDEVELSRWYYTVLTGIPYDQLRDSADARARAEAIWHSHPEWGDVIVADYSASNCSIGTIKRLIKMQQAAMAEEEKELTIFLLDYIALLDGLSENLYTGLGVVARELRKMARKYKMLVFTAAQANRTALMEGETRVWHIADSMEIPRVMDALLMLSQNDQERELSELRMRLDKNRFGSQNPRVTMDCEEATLIMKQRGA